MLFYSIHVRFEGHVLTVNKKVYSLININLM